MTALPTVNCVSPPSPLFRRSTRELGKEARSTPTETQWVTRPAVGGAHPSCEGQQVPTLVDGAGGEGRRDVCGGASAVYPTGAAVCFVDEPVLLDDKLAAGHGHGHSVHKEKVNSSRRSLLSQLTAVTVQRSGEWLTQPCSMTALMPTPAAKSGELPVLGTAIGPHGTFCAAARMRFVVRSMGERSNTCGRVVASTTPSLTSPAMPHGGDLGARWAGRTTNSSHSLQGMLLEPVESTAMQPLSPIIATNATACRASTDAITSRTAVSSPVRPRISLFELIMPRHQQPFLSFSSLAANVGVVEQVVEVQRTLAAAYGGAGDEVNLEQPGLSLCKEDDANCGGRAVADSLPNGSLPSFALAATATVSYARVTPTVERAAEDEVCVSVPMTPAPPTRRSLSARSTGTALGTGTNSRDGSVSAASRQSTLEHTPRLGTIRPVRVARLPTVAGRDAAAETLEQRVAELWMCEFDARYTIEHESERAFAKLGQREVAAYLRVQLRLRRVAGLGHTTAVRFPLLFAEEKRRLVQDCLVREACAEAEHQQTMQRLGERSKHATLAAYSDSTQPFRARRHTNQVGTTQKSCFASML